MKNKKEFGITGVVPITFVISLMAIKMFLLEELKIRSYIIGSYINTYHQISTIVNHFHYHHCLDNVIWYEIFSHHFLPFYVILNNLILSV